MARGRLAALVDKGAAVVLLTCLQQVGARLRQIPSGLCRSIAHGDGAVPSYRRAALPFVQSLSLPVPHTMRFPESPGFSVTPAALATAINAFAAPSAGWFPEELVRARLRNADTACTATIALIKFHQETQ